MGIENKSVVAAAVIALFLSSGNASAMEPGNFQMGGPGTGEAAGQGGAGLGADSIPMVVAASDDADSGGFGGVLGLPSQPSQQRRPFTFEQGDILVRMRFVDVITKSGGSAVNISPYLPVQGSQLSATGAASFEGDATYMLTSGIGVEVSLGSSSHDLKDKNGKVASTTGKGSDLIGSVSMMPLTVMAQYHFMPKSTIHPYVGGGLNYTLFNKEQSGLSGATLGVDNTFGFAVQFGMDVGFHDKWFLNADLKYLDMSSKMKLSSSGGGVVDQTDLKISPWILGIGIGTYF